MLRHSKNVAD